MCLAGDGGCRPWFQVADAGLAVLRPGRLLASAPGAGAAPSNGQGRGPGLPHNFLQHCLVLKCAPACSLTASQYQHQRGMHQSCSGAERAQLAESHAAFRQDCMHMTPCFKCARLAGAALWGPARSTGPGRSLCRGVPPVEEITRILWGALAVVHAAQLWRQYWCAFHSAVAWRPRRGPKRSCTLLT